MRVHDLLHIPLGLHLPSMQLLPHRILNTELTGVCKTCMFPSTVLRYSGVEEPLWGLWLPSLCCFSISSFCVKSSPAWAHTDWTEQVWQLSNVKKAMQHEDIFLFCRASQNSLTIFSHTAQAVGGDGSSLRPRHSQCHCSVSILQIICHWSTKSCSILLYSTNPEHLSCCSNNFII